MGVQRFRLGGAPGACALEPWRTLCGVAWPQQAADEHALGVLQQIVLDAGDPNRQARLLGGPGEALDHEGGPVVQGIAQRGWARLLLRQCQVGASSDTLHALMLGLR